MDPSLTMEVRTKQKWDSDWEGKCRPCFDKLLLFLSAVVAQWLGRKFTDQLVRGSDPTPASRLLLSRLGSIYALVLPSSDMAVLHRRGFGTERFSLLFKIALVRESPFRLVSLR
ncbi:hypothetical protein CSKR_105183 [Clonorchis sinensis]|uniref:Uncharacterized protein n=1 Tax=Clonorchis sinensis TaxID=79923 RepID=A0A3R7JMF8_CLOSI|nr:hypothetical protein CSKR_105183 [Clonorchis sinensis]